MKLRSKMFISYVVVAVVFTAVSCIALGWLVYKDASEALATSAKERLVISRNESASQIERYFDTVASQAQNMSHDLSILDAVKGFTQAFMDYPVRPDDSEALRNYYRNEFVRRYHDINTIDSVSELIGAIRTSTQRVENVMSDSLESATACAERVNNAQDTWHQVEEAIANISLHVEKIGGAISEQDQQLNVVSSHFSHMDQQFDVIQQAIEESALIGEDIDKMGTKLQSFASLFQVTNDDFATARRAKVRNEG
ncbi:methyl-accepting chemotaxis protein [Vibrio fluvialis]|uniref:methyl-accepting chemotaxis protein n=1 Tax=Vibrio fluvialis TaxID=676 RepID=UPI001EEAF316|nr:methyl-accepting chemotaxis protein [Vibrio fluvialis]MCG6384384.1 methyl-accepting chemotaxis protein [Vibrio fluvialis]